MGSAPLKFRNAHARIAWALNVVQSMTPLSQHQRTQNNVVDGHG